MLEKWATIKVIRNSNPKIPIMMVIRNNMVLSRSSKVETIKNLNKEVIVSSTARWALKRKKSMKKPKQKMRTLDAVKKDT